MLIPSGQLGTESARLSAALKGVRAWVAAAMAAVPVKFADAPANLGYKVESFTDGLTTTGGGDPAVERVALITGFALVTGANTGLYAQFMDEIAAALILGALVLDACSKPQVGGPNVNAQLQMVGSPQIGPTGEGRTDLAIRIPWRLRICLRVADDSEDTST